LIGICFFGSLPLHSVLYLLFVSLYDLANKSSLSSLNERKTKTYQLSDDSTITVKKNHLVAELKLAKKKLKLTYRKAINQLC